MTDPRVALVALAKRIGERQLTISTGGNISAKLPDGRMIITPSKHHRSMSDIEISDLSIIGSNGELIEGPKPSVELPMHLAVHAVAPSMTWIVHAHPPLAVAYACEKALPEESYIEASRLRISVIGQEAPGSKELARAVSDKIRSGSNAILMEGHGVVVVSDDANDAYLLLEELENACKTDLARRVLRTTSRG